MKHFRKMIAVLLSALLLSTMALPVVAFAQGEVAGDHTSFDEFYAEMTDENGEIDWKKLPQSLFTIYFWVKLFEAIGEWIRGIFGITVVEKTEPVSAAAIA